MYTRRHRHTHLQVTMHHPSCMAVSNGTNDCSNDFNSLSLTVADKGGGKEGSVSWQLVVKMEEVEVLAYV